METTTRVHATRLGEMCSLHQTWIAIAAADSLDGQINLAAAFEAYAARCAAGTGCDR